MRASSSIVALLLVYSNDVVSGLRSRSRSSTNLHLDLVEHTSSVSSPVVEHASSITTGETSSAQMAGSGGTGTNPIFQLAGYVKDSFVRMKDGSVQLYTNHKRCKSIRQKQKLFLEQAALALPQHEQKAATKYHINAGGITYGEFDFLQKGKEDRGRLANMVFMMVFAPNFVPYAFMFFPDMLPSSFQMPMNGKLGAANFSKWDMMSRERAHAVLQTMIDVERSARVAPILSNLNPFGKGRTKRNMEKMDTLGHACGALLSADRATGRNGAELVMKVLEDEIYSVEEPNKGRNALTFLPKSILKGLGKALDAPSSSSMSFLPAFLVRGKVLNNLSQIKTADEFLVAQNVDLTTLDNELLQDACSKRLIGGPGCTKEEMVQGLSSWMDLAVRQPIEKTKKSGKSYNGNLARAALLCYNAVDGARDARASSFLPRLMYQGQLYSNLKINVVANSDSRRSQSKLNNESSKTESSPGRKWFK